MWKKVNNSSEIKPLQVEFVEVDNLYYVRKNFVEKITEEGNAYWQYDENIFNVEEYENYCDNEKNNSLINYVAIMADIDLPTEV